MWRDHVMSEVVERNAWNRPARSNPHLLHFEAFTEPLFDLSDARDHEHPVLSSAAPSTT